MRVFLNFININSKSNNMVIRNLSNLLKKMRFNKIINPLPYYKKIFEDCDDIVFNKKGYNYYFVFKYIFEIISQN